MKRFGKVFLISITPRILAAILATWFLLYCVNYYETQNADAIAANAKVLADNSKQIAEQQASVDAYTLSVKAAIAKDQTILATYGTAVLNPQEDPQTKNLITYDLIQHQSACMKLVKEYSSFTPTLPSYIKTETFTTSDCLPLSYVKENS